MGRKHMKVLGWCRYKQCMAPIHATSPVCSRHGAMANPATLDIWRRWVRMNGGRASGHPQYELLCEMVNTSIEKYELAVEGGEIPQHVTPPLPGME